MKSFNFYKLLVLICFGVGINNPSDGVCDSLTREVWRGNFVQSSPMEWKGEMILYRRFDIEEENPGDPNSVSFNGIVIWPTLGKATTLIKGKFNINNKVEFEEISCIEGDCSKVVLGGRYIGVAENGKIKGTAKGTGGLEGEFILNKVRN